MTFPDSESLQGYLAKFEKEGLITRTFRRLDAPRQQAVFQAILDEAVARGPAEMNIKQVAKRAGVAIGSLYQYFPDRDGMLDFAVELCVRYVVDAFNAYLPMIASMPLREALEAYIMGGIEWSRTETNLVRFFGRAAYHGDPLLLERLVRPIAEVMRSMVLETLTQAAQRGELRPQVDLEATARAVNALMIAVGDAMLLPYLNTYFQVVDESVSAERLVPAMLDMILKGIAAVPAPGDN